MEPPPRRFRFYIEADIYMLWEVREEDPYRNPTLWLSIAENLSLALVRPISARAIPERCDLLLAQFAQEDRANLRKRPCRGRGGDTDYFDSLFGFSAENVPPLGGLLRVALEKIIGGKLLETAQGLCILQLMKLLRNWKPKVYHLAIVTALGNFYSTPRIDMYMYKSLQRIPSLVGSQRFILSGEVTVPDSTNIEITELPVGVWTETYKEKVI
ncbi:hypothetical protein MTO96_050976 [Rhipicephalus appendiculatus]